MRPQRLPAATLPPQCPPAGTALRAVLEAVCRADEWDAPMRQATLAWVAQQRDVLAAVEGKILTAERDAGTWSLRGDRDLAGFVGRQTRTGRGAGMAAVAQAGTLAAMPAIADALVDGPVTATHVAAITRATAASPALAAELATAEGQEQVVAMAGRLDGADFGKALAQLGASLDPATRQRSHDEQRADRFLHLTHTPSGTLLKGRLDTVAGHELSKALDALNPRPAVDDERTSEQRRADALSVMVRRVLTDKDTLPGSLAPVQAVLTMTQDTFTALRAAHDETAVEGTPQPGSTVDVVGRLRGVAPVTDESGQAWPASEIARALCDCTLTRAVIGTDNARLDLGRESRLFKRQHWLALYAAGTTTCAVPGCGMPLAYCELHHIAWWYEHHGNTDQDNCLPYCSFHHHEIHRKAIVISRLPDGRIAHRYPDGRPYGGAPRDVATAVAAAPKDAYPDVRPYGGALPDNRPAVAATHHTHRADRQPSPSGIRRPALGPARGPARAAVCLTRQRGVLAPWLIRRGGRPTRARARRVVPGARRASPGPR